MTDYRLIGKAQSSSKIVKKPKFKYVLNEQKKLSSKNLESDRVLAKDSSLKRTPRHLINAKRPDSFCAYGSAENYYSDAIYNIVNYYPFDGTREELIDWYLNSNRVDVAVLKQVWPGTVGHLKLNYDQYVSFYSGPNKIKETEALILQNNSFDEFISKSSCHFIGDGAEKSELLFKRENTKFTPTIYPSAKVMAQFVEQAFIAQKFEDTAYFEPYYLKDFVDGKKNKN